MRLRSLGCRSWNFASLRGARLCVSTRITAANFASLRSSRPGASALGFSRNFALLCSAHLRLANHRTASNYAFLIYAWLVPATHRHASNFAPLILTSQVIAELCSELRPSQRISAVRFLSHPRTLLICASLGVSTHLHAESSASLFGSGRRAAGLCTELRSASRCTSRPCAALPVGAPNFASLCCVSHRFATPFSALNVALLLSALRRTTLPGTLRCSALQLAAPGSKAVQIRARNFSSLLASALIAAPLIAAPLVYAWNFASPCTSLLRGALPHNTWNFALPVSSSLCAASLCNAENSALLLGAQLRIASQGTLLRYSERFDAARRLSLNLALMRGAGPLTACPCQELRVSSLGSSRLRVAWTFASLRGAMHISTRQCSELCFASLGGAARCTSWPGTLLRGAGPSMSLQCNELCCAVLLHA